MLSTSAHRQLRKYLKKMQTLIEYLTFQIRLFIPPHVVKSILVWNAKMVKATVTAHVSPTAISIASVLKSAQKHPSINPVKKVNE